VLVEGRGAHAGLGGQRFHRDWLRVLAAQQLHRPRHALHVAIGPAELADRIAMAAGQQPVVHLAHPLRLQYR
jgi:hypothetical protein